METEQQLAVADLLVKDGLIIIEARYGENGLNPLGYHNQHHTKGAVIAGKAVMHLAIQNGNYDAALAPAAITAFGRHDTRQLLGSGVNEAESIAEMYEANERIGRRGPRLLDHLAEHAAQYMAATVVFIDKHGVLRQSPIGNDYGELIMADADLFSLGAPGETFWPQVQGLFTELYGPDADRETQTDFLARSQVPLLECHDYYTPEAAKLFPNQGMNLNSTVKVLDLLKSGDERYERLLHMPYSQNPQLFTADR